MLYFNEQRKYVYGFSNLVSNTRNNVSSDVVGKTGHNRGFFKLRGVWKLDETLLRVFEIVSRTINNSWRISKQKFTKFYEN